MASSPEPLTFPSTVRPRLRGVADARAMAAGLWAVAAAIWASRVWDSWSLPHLGFDLRPIHAAGVALAQGKSVYGVKGFLYPPSAALLVGRPLALAPLVSERQAAAIVVSLLVVGSVMLGARAMGADWLGPASAAGAVAASLVGLLGQLLFLDNLSALVAFGAAAALLAWTRGRDLLAGGVLGLTLAVKPMLAILVVGLLVLRRWRALAAAVAVPLVLNALVLAFDGAAFGGVTRNVSNLLAGLGSSYDAHNGALESIGRMIRMPTALTLGLRVVVAGSAVAAAVLIWRRRPDPARSLEAAGVLLAGVFVTSSLYENHFLFVLVPFALACLEARSPFRWWPTAFFAALAAAVVVVPGRDTGLTADQVLSTQRGLALAAVVICVLVAVLRSARAMRDARPTAAPAKVMN